jgi:hypothetical protein
MPFASVPKPPSAPALAPLADSITYYGSCFNLCGEASTMKDGGDCYCDIACKDMSDCCDDFEKYCLASTPTSSPLAVNDLIDWLGDGAFPDTSITVDDNVDSNFASSEAAATPNSFATSAQSLIHADYFSASAWQPLWATPTIDSNLGTPVQASHSFGGSSWGFTQG